MIASFAYFKNTFAISYDPDPRIQVLAEAYVPQHVQEPSKWTLPEFVLQLPEWWPQWEQEETLEDASRRIAYTQTDGTVRAFLIRVALALAEHTGHDIDRFEKMLLKIATPTNENLVAIRYRAILRRVVMICTNHFMIVRKCESATLTTPAGQLDAFCAKAYPLAWAERLLWKWRVHSSNLLPRRQLGTYVGDYSRLEHISGLTAATNNFRAYGGVTMFKKPIRFSKGDGCDTFHGGWNVDKHSIIPFPYQSIRVLPNSDRGAQKHWTASAKESLLTVRYPFANAPDGLPPFCKCTFLTGCFAVAVMYSTMQDAV